jgi:hypothetical protein
VDEIRLRVVAGIGLQRVLGELVVERDLVRLVTDTGEEIGLSNGVTVTHSLLAPLGLRTEITLTPTRAGTEDVVLRLRRRATRELVDALCRAGIDVSESRTLL